MTPTPAPTPHHAHFMNLGQVIGLALIGLQAYSQQNQSPGGAAVFLDPATVAPYLQGILSLFPPPPAAQP